MNSNRKGKNGERELAAKLREYGLTAKRGQQHKGGPDSADVEVEEWPDIHIECKRTEKLQLYPAMKQALQDCHGEGVYRERHAVVVHRRNGEDWVVVLPLHDFIVMVNATDESDYWLKRTQYWKARADKAENELGWKKLEEGR